MVLKYEKMGIWKNFYAITKEKEYKLSLGDVLADYNWGVKYMPNSKCRKMFIAKSVKEFS